MRAAALPRARPAAQAPETSRRSARIAIVLLAILGLGLAVLVRAYRLQIVEGGDHRSLAEAQQLREVRLAPRRGSIFDRHGVELAVSVDADSVHANPRAMRRAGVDVTEAATRLASVLGIDRERIATRLASDRMFVWLERQVTPEEAAAVQALAIEGVSVTSEARRYYPNRELAAHILGFANVDGDGIEGIELALDERLRGQNVVAPAVRDRRGRVVFSEQLLDDTSGLGESLTLTIDKAIQHTAERELALSVRTFEAQAGSVVVMDPHTGEILAMASYPTFDPNNPSESPPSHRRFRAITDRFEPGSTIKPMTVAAALAAGVLRPNEQIDCHDGRWTVVEGEQPITDTHPWGLLSPAEVLAHSSNIGSAQIGMRLGRAGLYRAFRRFGFGQPTGLPLVGEVAGTLRHPSRWYERDFASVAFGQGMSVTALQLATGLSVIANGGRLMRPTLIRQVTDGQGRVVESSRPDVRRQVIPSDTARLVGDMLTAVTSDEGTGAEAAIDGYLVAGKTGTAQMANLTGSGYSEDRWLSSFVGFVPAHAPRVVIAVIIQEPVIDHYGGVVAGPVFRRVGEATMRTLGVLPAGSDDALEAIAEQSRERVRAARAAAEAAAQVEGTAPTVPAPAAPVAEGAMPDVHGLSARAAFRRLVSLGLRPHLEGAGSVASQSPSVGTPVAPGQQVTLLLERPSATVSDTLALDEESP